MSDESPATGQQEGRKSRTRRQWTDLVEQLLEEARDRGDFDNLEGKGKPLALDQNPYAGDRALAYSLLKNNDFAPPEIERSKEIDSDIKRAEDLLETLRRHQHTLRGLASHPDARRAFNLARDATLKRYEALLTEITSKILSLNIVAPTPMHRRRLDIEAKLRQFREEFPHLEE
jgi:DnaJ homolog subfamily C member 28